MLRKKSSLVKILLIGAIFKIRRDCMFPSRYIFLKNVHCNAIVASTSNILHLYATHHKHAHDVAAIRCDENVIFQYLSFSGM